MTVGLMFIVAFGAIAVAFVLIMGALFGAYDHDCPKDLGKGWRDPTRKYYEHEGE